MKKYLFFCCFFFLTFNWAIAQNGAPSTLGARSIAMGKTGVSLKGIDALLNNIAGLSNISSLSGLIAAEQRFASEDLQSLAAGVALPTNSGTFGLNIQHFGFDLYNEQRLGVFYARKLLPNLSIGAQFLLHNTQIEEYGNKLLPSFDLGLQLNVTDQITVGANIFNPIRQEIVADEFLPTIMRLGVSYQSSDKVIFVLEASKDIEYPVQVNAGIEYMVIEQLFLRTGISTEPTLWSFGVGYYMEASRLQIDISASNHQFLGFTPAITIGYR